MKWTIGRRPKPSVAAPVAIDNEQQQWREYKDAVQAGKDYRDLVSSPAWKRLLDDLEFEANKILGTLRASESTDPNVIRALWLRWKMFEQVIQFIEDRAKNALERADQVLSHAPPQDPSHLDMSDEQENAIHRFMKAEPVFDQFDEEEEKFRELYTLLPK